MFPRYSVVSYGLNVYSVLYCPVCSLYLSRALRTTSTSFILTTSQL